MVLNKNNASDCMVTLNLSEGFQDGRLTRVRAGSRGISSIKATWGGKGYAFGQVRLSGNPEAEVITAVGGRDAAAAAMNGGPGVMESQQPKPAVWKLSGCQGGTSYTFMMPKASAALLVTQSKPRSSC